MPYITKTPSGKYKCQYRCDGKYKCVTASTRREAEYLALEDQMMARRRKEIGPTVGESIRSYIDSRNAVLSPATIAGYEKIFRNYIDGIKDRPLSGLTQLDYQTFVNSLSGQRNRRGVVMSPKTIANVCGLIEAAARESGITLTAKRPAPRKHVTNLISPEAVISLVRGDRIELPVLLAAWLSLSMSEIRGLQAHSVHGRLLIVQGAVVDVDGVAVRKEANKAYQRTRTLPIPEPIMNLIKETDAWKAGTGPLISMTGQAIYKRWIRLQQAAGIYPPVTFHALRHLNASVMLALGVPDTYAMTRGGWQSRQTLTNIYQHTLAERQPDYDARIDDYFTVLYNGQRKS